MPWSGNNYIRFVSVYKILHTKYFNNYNNNNIDINDNIDINIFININNNNNNKCNKNNNITKELV